MKIFSALLFALVVATTGDQHAPARVTANPFSAERLARLDKVLQQYVDENRLAGVVALVLRDGKPSTSAPSAGATRKPAGR
jgi:hypothetical protein